MNIIPGTNWWVEYREEDGGYFYDPVLYFKISEVYDDDDITIMDVSGEGLVVEADNYVRLIYCTSDDLSKIILDKPHPSTTRHDCTKKWFARRHELSEKAEKGDLTDEEKAELAEMMAE